MPPKRVAARDAPKEEGSCGSPLRFRHGRHDGVDDRAGRRWEIVGEPIAHPLRVTPVDDETDGSEGRHMPAYRRLAGAQLDHKFANAMLSAVPKDAERSEASGFGERREE